MKKSLIIYGEINTPLSIIYKTRGREIKETIEELSNITNHLKRINI